MPLAAGKAAAGAAGFGVLGGVVDEPDPQPASTSAMSARTTSGRAMPSSLGRHDPALRRYQASAGPAPAPVSVPPWGEPGSPASAS